MLLWKAPGRQRQHILSQGEGREPTSRQGRWGFCSKLNEAKWNKSLPLHGEVEMQGSQRGDWVLGGLGVTLSTFTGYLWTKRTSQSLGLGWLVAKGHIHLLPHVPCIPSQTYYHYTHVLLMELWMKNIACHRVNKGYCSHQAITLQPPQQWALRELTMETGCPLSNHQTLQPSNPNSTPWGDSGWESPGYWPQMAEVRIKGMISVSPDSCIFPYMEKC